MRPATVPRIFLSALIAAASGAAGAQERGNPAMPCFRGLAGDARFALIQDKVSLGGDMEQMRKLSASAARPSAPESDALGEWKRARDVCHREEIPYFATRDTEIQALAKNYFATVQALITELQGGKLTYGDFSRRRLELYEKANARVEELRQQILPPKPTPHQPPGTK